MPLPWLEKPEIDTDFITQQFAELVEYFLAMRNGSAVKFYEELAKKMSAAIAKSPPWSARYMQSVHKGTLKPSREFARAVAVLGAEIDGVPELLARMEKVEVYAEPGTIQHGAMVMGKSVVCARPGCRRVFVPNHPRRRSCFICSPFRGHK